MLGFLSFRRSFSPLGVIANYYRMVFHLGGGFGRLAPTLGHIEHPYAHGIGGVERGEREAPAAEPIITYTIERRAMVGARHLAMSQGLMCYPHDHKWGLWWRERVVSPDPRPHQCPCDLVPKQKEPKPSGVGSWPWSLIILPHMTIRRRRKRAKLTGLGS